jgi:phytanoyl-CoA hydroxylase
MAVLSEEQIAQFWRDGVLTVENAVTPEELAALRRDFDGWVEESRSHDGPYGEAMDGRPRFDVQPGHTAAKPALRRVQAPTEVSGAYYQAMADSRMADMVADLIGPDVKLHHTKINSKLPGSATEVKWHQDFPFTPHSNSDLITALLMVDEVTPENGPLEVQKGSHRGPIHSLWHDGVFTGAVAPELEAEMKRDAVSCHGPAGSVCLMHTRVAHGSAPNLSDGPRTLFICVYSAGDAMPCSPNPVPTAHQGLFVRGADPHRVRGEDFTVRTPQFPKTSFFAQQSETERTAS